MKTLKEINDLRNEFIAEAKNSNGNKIRRFTLDLSIARTEDNPYVIGYPFKCIAFENATSSTAEVFCKFDSNNSGVAKKSFKDNGVLTSNKIFAGAFISNVAQANETIKVTVFLESDYTTGSLKNSGTIEVSSIQDPVTISEIETPVVLDNGNTLAITNPAISATTATQVVTGAAANREVRIYNDDTETIYVGADNTVTNSGATKGEPIPAGMMWLSNCADSVWLYSVGGNAAGLVTVALESRV